MSSSAQSGRVSGIAVWDGRHELGTRTLTWEGDRIAGLADASTDVSLSEYSVIPGLVDTHVHLGGYAGSGRADFSSWPLITPPEERSLHVAANARRAAEAGITTLRDLAGDGIQLAAARAFDEGLIPGPRLLVHGPVGMTAGHGDLFTPPFFPVRGPVADSPDECRKLVRQWARAGATGVKIFTSGGVLSVGDKVGWRNQTLAEIRTTIDEAHALGMLVAAHTHSTEGVQIALDEGVDSIEHGTGIVPSQWDQLLARNIPVAPTLLINDLIAEGRVPVSEEAQAKARTVVAERDAEFTEAGRAGVRFVLGTDANGAMVRFGDQHQEVRMMAEKFDWTAERALVAATSDAADVLGLGGSVGTLAEGYGADFVIVKGRPWEDISTLRLENVVAVVSRGALISGSLPA